MYNLIKQDNGDTALHIACRRRDMDLARLLVDAGAPVDLQNVRYVW